MDNGLKDLFDLLRKAGIKSIEFFPTSEQPLSPASHVSLASPIKEVPSPEPEGIKIDQQAVIPPIDDVMSYDQVLNWSTAPSSDEQPLPLTGDAPLGEAAL